MGDHDQAPGELPQVVLQPEDHVAVQVVGGLVEDEHIRRVEEDGGQGHPLPLAPGEGVHRLGKVRDPQAGEHGLGLVLQQGPGVRGEVVKDLLQHRGPRHHLRVLGEEAHLDVGVQGDRPLVGDLLPRQHPEEAALPRAVDADDADLVPLIEIEGDIVQQLLQAEIQADVLRGEQHRNQLLLWPHWANLTGPHAAPRPTEFPTRASPIGPSPTPPSHGLAREGTRRSLPAAPHPTD